MALLDAVKIQGPQTFFIWKQQENSSRQVRGGIHLSQLQISMVGYSSSLAGTL